MINEAVLNKSLPPEFSASTAEFSITFFKDVKTAMMIKDINPDFVPIVDYVIKMGEISKASLNKSGNRCKIIYTDKTYDLKIEKGKSVDLKLYH